MPNDITPHLNLPLPHPDNLLETDVERLREAFVLLDGSAAAVSAALVAQRETSAAQQAALERQDAALSQVAEVADAATQGIQTEATARQTADAGHDATLAGLTARLDALAAAVSAITVDPWDVFPLRVPIAVDGVRFGGSDGRRAILPGETQARENWILCDGGSDGLGGTVPDLRGRMILGANAGHPAGSVGGSETHAHSVTGTVGASTLSVEQLASHNHQYAIGYNNNGPALQGSGPSLGNGGNAIQATGSSLPHAHTFAASSGAAAHLPPHLVLAYIMRTS